MKLLVSTLIMALALVAAGLPVTPATANVPPNASTVTNVCLVYEDDGLFSGGIAVFWPETVSYRYIGGSGDAFLWLPDGRRLRVEYLGISPLQPGEACIGILLTGG